MYVQFGGAGTIPFLSHNNLLMLGCSLEVDARLIAVDYVLSRDPILLDQHVDLAQVSVDQIRTDNRLGSRRDTPKSKVGALDELGKPTFGDSPFRLF